MAANPARARSLTRRRHLGFGGKAITVSLFFHLLLAVIAVFWVISRHTDATPEDPTTFATGAGGGDGGKNARNFEHRIQPKNAARDMVNAPTKIAAKGVTSALALPDVPNMGMSAFESGALNGGSSKGLGGGSGGGIGAGMGVGVGDGKNFAGKFIMGTRVKARKIAVYLDCSGSMIPFLPQVKKEIYEQFPDADIFEILAIRVAVVDGDVYMGGNYRGKPLSRLEFKNQPNRTFTNTEKLSPSGKIFYNKHREKLEKGSFGAWVDLVLREKYDALVAFSDFQDGVRQYDKDMKAIFADSKRRTMEDNRTTAQKSWENRWMTAFRKPGAPKLYLFSIETEPQQFLKNCVTVSDGEIKMVTHLRQRRGKRSEK